MVNLRCDQNLDFVSFNTYGANFQNLQEIAPDLQTPTEKKCYVPHIQLMRSEEETVQIVQNVLH